MDLDTSAFSEDLLFTDAISSFFHLENFVVDIFDGKAALRAEIPIGDRGEQCLDIRDREDVVLK